MYAAEIVRVSLDYYIVYIIQYNDSGRNDNTVLGRHDMIDALYYGVLCAVVIVTFSFISACSPLHVPLRIWLLMELLAVVMTILPLALESQILRFLSCTFSIMCFMSMHIRIFRNLSPCLHNKQQNNDSAKLLSFVNFRRNVLYSEILETIFYHSGCFIEDVEPICRAMSVCSCGVHFLSTLFVGDLCILVLFDIMPQFGDVNQDHVLFSSVAVGVWLYCALELAYYGHQMLLWLNGCQLIPSFRRRSPIVSTTLSEFWGVRWNPVIMKLLQNSFYTPLRRMNADPLVCAVVTFGGSAWLHAFPIYAHSFSAVDTACVALFFVIHGGLVVFERVFIQHFAKGVFRISSQDLYVPKRYSAEVTNNTCWLVDMTFYFTIVCYYWWYLYIFCGNESDGDGAILMYASMLLIMFLSWSVGKFHYSISPERRKSRKFIVVVGWLWSIVCIFLTLPLLAMPAIKVLQSSYSTSFFAGPVLRYLYVI